MVMSREASKVVKAACLSRVASRFRIARSTVAGSTGHGLLLDLHLRAGSGLRDARRFPRARAELREARRLGPEPPFLTA